jgi:hypothetical protein
MGEGYVHQGHFLRMSSHDVTNVLPLAQAPRPRARHPSFLAVFQLPPVFL